MYLFKTGNCQNPVSEPEVPIAMVSDRIHCLNIKFWNKKQAQVRKWILFRVLAYVYSNKPQSSCVEAALWIPGWYNYSRSWCTLK